MKILNIILSFITDPGKRTFVLALALVAATLLWFRSCENNRNLRSQMEVQQQISDQNTRALTDSIRQVKNRAGDIETVKSSFIAKLEDLEKLNKDLFLESKREIGDLKAIIKSGISINNPLQVSNTLENLGNDNYGLVFDKSQKTDSLDFALKGISKFSLKNNVIVPGITEITTNSINMKLVLGFTELENGDYKIFARSPSKLIKIDDLTGSLIIPKKGGDIIPQAAEKKKRFGVGPSVGLGFGTSMRLMPIVGVSLSYNIIRF